MKATNYKLFSVEKLLALSFISFILSSCTYQEFEPAGAKLTPQLTAYYTEQPPSSIKDPRWRSLNYYTITVSDQVTGQKPADDGILNTYGTFNGLSSFNKGLGTEVLLRALYDDTNVYIFASWNDESFSPANHNWYYNGPADSKKGDNGTGWTRQRSDDKLQFNFDMGAGKKDVWQWSLGLSEPVGYALDMMLNGSLLPDAGTMPYFENELDDTNRSGPKYEWDGTSQTLNRELGGYTILDPGFFVLNSTDYLGDVVNGDAEYQLHCAKCHGVNGDGAGYDYESGVSFRLPGSFSRISRSGMDSHIDRPDHDGQGYWNAMTAEQKEDVKTRLYSWSGIPGNVLQVPAGSSADIKAISNVVLGKIDIIKKNTNGYQVMFVRKLNTGNADDAVFSPKDGLIDFDIYLYDNDDLNSVGSTGHSLFFKPKSN